MQKPPQLFSSSQWQHQPGWVRKGLIPVLLIALIGGGGYYYYANYYLAPAGDDAAKAAAAKPGPGGGGPGGAAGKGGGRPGGLDPNRIQPVIAVPAKVADINVVQTALGTVAALKVATVKARVDALTVIEQAR